MPENLHVDGALTTGRGPQSPGTVTLFPPDGWAWFHIDNGPAGGRPVGRLRISIGGTPGEQEIVSVLQTGRVGVNIADPSTAFHVNGEATVSNLHLTGGSDIAEPFAVERLADIAAEPGTVMVIDEDNPGALKISAGAYDTKVAGIVSGAGDLKPGLTLCQESSAAAGVHVALSGRVYCKTEAISAPIRPGDLLTTSDIPGHAMKAGNLQAAQGAMIGKAMTALDEGTGLVIVLVTLQ